MSTTINTNPKKMPLPAFVEDIVNEAISILAEEMSQTPDIPKKHHALWLKIYENIHRTIIDLIHARAFIIDPKELRDVIGKLNDFREAGRFFNSREAEFYAEGSIGVLTRLFGTEETPERPTPEDDDGEDDDEDGEAPEPVEPVMGATASERAARDKATAEIPVISVNPIEKPLGAMMASA